MDWPPGIPDLNPNEHLWGYIKQKPADFKPQNKAQLWKRVKDIWYSIEDTERKKRVQNMKERVQAMIQAKGGNTRY